MVDRTHLGKLADQYRKAQDSARLAMMEHEAELNRVKYEELAEYHDIARAAFQAFHNAEFTSTELVEWSEKLQDILAPKHHPAYNPTKDELQEVFTVIKELRAKVPQAVHLIELLLQRDN